MKNKTTRNLIVLLLVILIIYIISRQGGKGKTRASYSGLLVASIIVLGLAFGLGCVLSNQSHSEIKENFAGNPKGFYRIEWDPPTNMTNSEWYTVDTCCSYLLLIEENGKTIVRQSYDPGDPRIFEFGKGDSESDPVGGWNTKYTIFLTASNDVGTGPTATKTFTTGSGPPSEVRNVQIKIRGSDGQKRPVRAGDNLTTITDVFVDFDTNAEMVPGDSRSTLFLDNMQNGPCTFTYQTGTIDSSGNGEYTFRGCGATLKEGDKLNYTIYVKNSFGEKKHQGTYVVSSGISKPGPVTNISVKWIGG